MKKRGRASKKTVVTLVVVAVIGFVIARNVLAKAAVVGGVKAATGLGIEIGSLDVGLFNTQLGVKGLRVLNPNGFPDQVMVLLPELYVDYDLGSFLKGQAHLKTVRMDLAELVVVKNEAGQVNVNSLRPIQEKNEAAAKKEKKPAKPTPLQVDVLEFKVGRVVYKDYSKTANPVVKTFDLNLHERIEHVTSPEALASAVLVRTLAKTTLAQLTNIDLKTLQATATKGVLGTASSLATGALDSAIGTQGTAALKTLLSGRKTAEEQRR